MPGTPRRGARYGSSLYEIAVPTHFKNAESPDILLYFCADSVTVREGVLMLAAEVNESDDDAGESAIELPPVAIFAPGRWFSCIMVGWKDHEPIFSEAAWREAEDKAGDD
jgi:hypothetical protein